MTYIKTTILFITSIYLKFYDVASIHYLLIRWTVQLCITSFLFVFCFCFWLAVH